MRRTKRQEESWSVPVPPSRQSSSSWGPSCAAPHSSCFSSNLRSPVLIFARPCSQSKVKRAQKIQTQQECRRFLLRLCARGKKPLTKLTLCLSNSLQLLQKTCDGMTLSIAMRKQGYLKNMLEERAIFQTDEQRVQTLHLRQL
jgi:hypothetical protein